MLPHHFQPLEPGGEFPAGPVHGQKQGMIRSQRSCCLDIGVAALPGNEEACPQVAGSSEGTRVWADVRIVWQKNACGDPIHGEWLEVPGDFKNPIGLAVMVAPISQGSIAQAILMPTGFQGVIVRAQAQGPLAFALAQRIGFRLAIA